MKGKESFRWRMLVRTIEIHHDPENALSTHPRKGSFFLQYRLGRIDDHGGIASLASSEAGLAGTGRVYSYRGANGLYQPLRTTASVSFIYILLDCLINTLEEKLTLKNLCRSYSSSE